jgi:hypothetical protein
VIREIETAVENVFNYLVAQLPTYIAQVNADADDDVTIDVPLVFELNNVPNDSVATSFMLMDTGLAYSEFTFGFVQVDIEFAASIDFQTNSVPIGRTKVLRYTDAIQNIFRADCSLGGNVVVSRLDKRTQQVNQSYGWVDIYFTGTIQIVN